MMPILYNADETSFSSNGLGRLRDCISFLVSEERNGIYEADFEYPVDGAHFEEIKVGRIIGATHDETGEIEPFDIVSYSRPINGVVTFHCVHISYRQSFMTVTGTNITTLADAFTLLETATPTNPFSYSTDKASTGYLGAANGIPRSVRQMLGGVDGSILDTYGGEYEWRTWSVVLHNRRGVDRDFSIRYGVNMLDCKEDYDNSSAYSSCIPYWTDGTTTVVGNKVDNPYPTITGRGECVPLDVSDKFESKPTQAQVEQVATSLISRNNSSLPAQNIHVEFVRIQDMPEYAGFGNLLKCNLCDTINVIFPDYNASGRFKIVKTVWDTLRDRYQSMELGDLSMSLSEALGITPGAGAEGGGQSELKDIIIRKTFTCTYSTTLASGAAVTLTGSDFDFTAHPTGYSFLGVTNAYASVNGISIDQFRLATGSNQFVRVRNASGSSISSFTVTVRMAWVKTDYFKELT